MSESTNISITQLFGLTNTTTLATLKKAYYEFAMLCHPDNGGNTQDMQVVQDAYATAKEQLQQLHESEDKMNQLVVAMEKGHLNTKDTPVSSSSENIPSLRDIFDEVHGSFHRDCQHTTEHSVQTAPNHTKNVCFEGCKNDPYATQGYGSYMLERWKHTPEPTTKDNEYYTYTPFVSDEPAPNIPEQELSHKRAIVSYDSETTSVGYPVHINTQQHIRDFTVSNGSYDKKDPPLPCTDYRLAFQNRDK